MKLEWDETKRAATLSARGLDFADVAKLDWDASITKEDNRYGEPRFVSFAPLGGRLYSIAWCRRGDAMRVISFRKANAREIRNYEQT